MAGGGVVCFSRMHNVMDRLRDYLLDFRNVDLGGGCSLMPFPRRRSVSGSELL